MPSRLPRVTLLALLVVALPAAAQAPATAPAAPPAQTLPTYPPPPFLPPAGHPRLYFTPKDLPQLRRNARMPQNARAWAEHRANLASGIDGSLPPAASEADGNTDSKVLSVITSYAYAYALDADEAAGRRAVEAIKNYCRTVVYSPKDYNNTGQTVFTIGAVYDWCYPLLTPADRDLLRRAALDTAAKMEIGWPPVRQGNVTGHGPEGQLFRDLLAAAVAMYDEDPDIYRLVAGRFFSRMVEPKKFMYPAHMHTQGVHYCNYRGQWELLATHIFDRMGLPQVFGPDQQYFMYWTLYARRGDGQVLRDGDTHINNRPLGEYWAAPFRPTFLAANYFRDPYLKAEALRLRPDLAPVPPRQNQSCDAVEILIFNDPALEPRPLADLPLTKYFPSPKGAMIARTGWQDGLASPAVVAEMKINEWYFANHQHLDAGAFQIYYRGALATDAGYYQAALNKGDGPGDNDGSSGYGSLYDVNYHKRSVAHNVVTVYDPNETFDTRRWPQYKIANDGGQRMPNRWQEPQDHEDLLNPANGYRIATVLSHAFGPDPKRPTYTYLKGDLTNAYSSKLRAYERTFLFLNLTPPAPPTSPSPAASSVPPQVPPQVPAVLIVLDRVVSADPAFRKAWLLHGLERPTLTGNRTTFDDTRPGYTGRLTVDTLLPEPDNATLTTIGGNPDEALVDGTAYKVLLRPDGLNEGGGWRLEVSPKSPQSTNHFLHVLQISDHTTPLPSPASTTPSPGANSTPFPAPTPLPPPPPPTRLDTPTHFGILLPHHLALLGKSRDPQSTPISFTLPPLPPTTAPLQVTLTDLTPGPWLLESPNLPPQTLTVLPTENLAHFAAAGPGQYRLSKVAAKDEEVPRQK